MGHVAVQLARHAGAEVVESGPVDLVFDTRGGEIPAGGRVVTIVDGVEGATYFVVEPDHESTAEVGRVGGRGRASPGSRLGLSAIAHLALLLSDAGKPALAAYVGAAWDQCRPELPLTNATAVRLSPC